MLSTPLSNPASAICSPGLEALLGAAAFAPLDSLGWVRVTGQDRARWLNGMVTNSIQALTPGQGCYNFVLNAQGRIQNDLTAWLLEDAILLESGRAGALAAWLDRYIIMDDVELAVLSLSAAEAATAPESPIPGERSGLLLAGPAAAATLTDLLPAAALPQPLHCVRLAWQSAELDLFSAFSPLVPRFELWGQPATIASVSAALLAAHVPVATPDDLEDLRLLEGTVLYGTDLRGKELPQESALSGTPSRALHFSKGCYLGQEIVERIHSRGALHRTFTGLLLRGDTPAAGTSLASSSAPGQPVGELTSVRAIVLPGGATLQLGLAYVRREALERGDGLIFSGGTAQPVSLPYLPAAHSAGLADEPGAENLHPNLR